LRKQIGVFVEVYSTRPTRGKSGSALAKGHAGAQRMFPHSAIIDSSRRIRKGTSASADDIHDKPWRVSLRITEIRRGGQWKQFRLLILKVS
jgi:hypothetical protein